ncbi:MAG: ABC transporter substrate binding protein [Comamonadaceae bacterium]|nr:hypothetical protein [Burkholderiales bacterium]MEB2349268.1 ABC transporter substrate binding protein [Comamonadaceae bacterium]
MPSTQPRHRPLALAFLTALALLAGSPPLHAQTAAAPRVIAYLGLGPSESVRVCMNQLRTALEEAGWSFDDRLVLEWNDAAGDPARLAPMAKALVARRPAVLISTENMSTEALMQATQELPIVVMGSTNLHSVLDAQLRPTANVTGVSLGLRGQYVLKPMEVLLQAFPQARRIGLIENNEQPGHVEGRVLTALTERVHGIGAELVRVRFKGGEAGIADAWGELARQQVDAVMIRPDSSGLLGEHARQAQRVRLPAIAHNSWFATRYGGLLSYGAVGRVDMCGRGGHYVDQVLRGRPLAELPVEELYEAALVVNLDAAQQLGVTLPPAFIARADRLIRPGERTLAPTAEATVLPPPRPPR